jgi:hypothetical protein
MREEVLRVKGGQARRRPAAVGIETIEQREREAAVWMTGG